MGFFTYVSKNKWITYTLLSIFGFTFIIAQSGGIIDYLTSSKTVQPDICIIDGKKVRAFKYQQIFGGFKQELLQQGYKKDEVNRSAHYRTWKYFLDQNIYTKLYESLGLKVTQQEGITTLEQARNMPGVTENPQFQDKKGNFDKAKWLYTLSKLTQTPQGRVQLKFMEENIHQTRLKDKLTYLTQATVHVTRLEAAQYPGNAKVNISYLYIPYTFSQEQDHITYQEKEAYLRSHSYEYQMKEFRTIEFVAIPITPSKQDMDGFKEELRELAIRFEQAKSPEDFAKAHTDNPKTIKVNWTESTMPPLLVAQLPALEKDQVVGPIEDSSSRACLYRLISCKTGWGKIKTYTMAKIEKQCKPSEYTNDEQFKKAQTFKKVRSLAQWQAKVKKHGLEIDSLVFPREYLQRTLGEKSTIRSMQRWLFDPKTKVNSVSDPIEDSDAYVVCIMKKESPARTASLKEVSHKIEARIRKLKAGQQITKKLQSLIKQKKSLREIAEAYGGDAKVYTLEDLTFDQKELPNAGFSPKAIGSSFALAVDERTGIIADRFGIFIIQRLPNTTKAFSSSTLINERKKELNEKEKEEVLNALYRFCLKKANVQDNRHVFF